MIKKVLKPLFLLSILTISMSVKGGEIYVSPTGNDTTGDGSQSAPYATITKGVEAASEGSEIIIREGTYREAIKIDKDNLTLKPYQDEYVLITGLIPVEGWRQEGNRWVAKVDRSAIDEAIVYTQFFVDGDRREPARYPNSDGDNFSFIEWMTSKTLMPEGERNERGYRGDRAGVELQQEFPTDYWKGGYYIGLNSPLGNNFNSAKGVIYHSDKNMLHCKDICWNWSHGWPSTVGDGQGYVIHHINALDAAGEWFYDDEQSLYYIPMKGEKPSKSSYEVRAKLYVMDLSECTGVTLEGLNFKCGLVDMTDANSCTIDRCTFRYLSPFSTYVVNAYGCKEDGSLGIYVSGVGNKIINSYLGSSWSSCLTIEGVETTVENNILNDGNWIAERCGLLNIYDKRSKILRNTMSNAGRGAVDGGNRFWIEKWGMDYEFAYNHVFRTMCLSVDGGSFYVNTKGSQYHLNAELHHNWISVGKKAEILRIRGENGKGHNRAGIYIDDNTSGAIVHHNVLYNVAEAIKTNGYPINNWIYNNTIIDGITSHSQWKHETKGSTYRRVVTANNIAISDTQIDGTINENNYYVDYNEDIWVDWRNLDFRLKDNSAAIDAGVVVEGITDGFKGSAPDAGAYEHGAERWVAGADWSISDSYFKDQKGYATLSSSPRTDDLKLYYSADAPTELRWSESVEGKYKVNIYKLADAGCEIKKIGTVKSGVGRFVVDDFVEDGVTCWFIVRYEMADGRVLPQSNEVRYLRHSSLDDDCSSHTNENVVFMLVKTEENPPLAGDIGQYVRQETPSPLSQAYATWHVSKIKDFCFSLFLYGESDKDMFTVFLSEDGVKWREDKSLKFSALREVEDGLFSCEMSNGELSGRDNFIKIKEVGCKGRLVYPAISHLKVNQK